MGEFETKDGCFKLARKYRKAKRLYSKCMKFQIGFDKLYGKLGELDLEDYIHALFPHEEDFDEI